MGIFDMIKAKLGFGDDETNEQPQEVVETANVEQETAAEPAPEASEAVNEAPQAEAVAVVDVVAKLETLSEQNPGLNWKTSIVDLMKLLGIDSSYTHRKELAAEMGIEGYEGTAEQNIALHKAVLAKIAQNGGNIPQELLA